MTPIHFHPQDTLNGMVGDFVSERVFGEPGRFEKFASMGIFEGADLVAGVVYHNWHRHERVLEFSGAGINGKWMSRRVLAECFGFAFNMMKARLVVLRIAESNGYMRELARKFGFTETVIPRIIADDEAECIFTISADEWAACRFNKVTHG